MLIASYTSSSNNKGEWPQVTTQTVATVKGLMTTLLKVYYSSSNKTKGELA